MITVATSEIPRYGIVLPDDQLPRPQRRDAQLLHRAALLLAHDGERRREHGRQHEQEADEPGYEELRRLELRVEEDPRLEVDGRAQALAAPRERLGHDREVLLGDERPRVAEDRRGGGRVGAVHDELHGCLVAPGEVAGVALGDDQDRLRQPPLRERLEVGAGRRRGHEVEVGGARERGDELAARPAPVAVLHREAHVAHVEVQRVAVEHEHEGGEADQHREREGVAPDLPQLLHDDGAQAPHRAAPAEGPPLLDGSRPGHRRRARPCRAAPPPPPRRGG